MRFHRGLEILGRGRGVVTDRLHGHILSSLMGIPHVALDNSYGKLSAFMDTWQMDRLADVQRVPSTDAKALELAVERLSARS